MRTFDSFAKLKFTKWSLFFLVIFIYQSCLRGGGFSPDTIIHTKEGSCPIESLILDQEVLGYTQQHGLGLSQVLYIAHDPTRFMVEISIGTEKIKALPLQRFFVPFQNTWKAAKNLCIGDELLSLATGSFVRVTDVAVYELDNVVYTTRIAVTGEHNFLVGNLLILAHNQHAEVIAVTPALYYAAEVAYCVGRIACRSAVAAATGPELMVAGGVAATGYGTYCAYQYCKRFWRQKEEAFKAHNAAYDTAVHDTYAAAQSRSNCSLKPELPEMVMTKMPTEEEFQQKVNKQLDIVKQKYETSSNGCDHLHSITACSLYKDNYKVDTSPKSNITTNCYTPSGGGAGISFSCPTYYGTASAFIEFNSRDSFEMPYLPPTAESYLYDKADYSRVTGLPALDAAGICMYWNSERMVNFFYHDLSLHEYKFDRKKDRWERALQADIKCVVFSPCKDVPLYTWVCTPDAQLRGKSVRWAVVDNARHGYVDFLDYYGKSIEFNDFRSFNYPFQVLLKEYQVFVNKNGDSYEFDSKKMSIFVYDRNHQLIAEYSTGGWLMWSLAAEKAKAQALALQQEQEAIRQAFEQEKAALLRRRALETQFFNEIQDLDFKFIEEQESFLENIEDLPVLESVSSKIPDNFLAQLPKPNICFDIESHLDDRGWRWIRINGEYQDGTVRHSDWLVFDREFKLLKPEDLVGDPMWQVLHENYNPLFACDKDKPFVHLPFFGQINVDDLKILLELLEAFWDQYGLPLLMLPEMMAIDQLHDNLFKQNRALTVDELYSIIQKMPDEEQLYQENKDQQPSTNSEPGAQKQDPQGPNDPKDPKEKNLGMVIYKPSVAKKGLFESIKKWIASGIRYVQGIGLGFCLAEIIGVIYRIWKTDGKTEELEGILEEEWFKDHPKIAKLIKAIMQVTVLSFALKGITNIFGKGDEDKIATLQAEISEYKTVIKRKDEDHKAEISEYKTVIKRKDEDHKAEISEYKTELKRKEELLERKDEDHKAEISEYKTVIKRKDEIIERKDELLDRKDEDHKAEISEYKAELKRKDELLESADQKNIKLVDLLSRAASVSALMVDNQDAVVA